MDTRGEGGDTAHKYLAAPSEAGASSTYFRYYVMKTMGLVPHVWHRGLGVTSAWRGIEEPESMEAMIDEQLVGDESGEDRTIQTFEDDEFAFPGCTVGNAKLLFEHVRDHCRDWRWVCCHGGYGYAPTFFMGESKALPHRWVGYVGMEC